jgi:hypothetical protein
MRTFDTSITSTQFTPKAARYGKCSMAASIPPPNSIGRLRMWLGRPFAADTQDSRIPNASGPAQFLSHLTGSAQKFHA